MPSLLNTSGTIVPFYKIGNTTIYQGASDPAGSYTIQNGDIWIDTTLNTIRMRVSGIWSYLNVLPDAYAGTYVNVTGDTMTGSLDMSNNVITGVATPIANSDATNKLYVEQQISDSVPYGQLGNVPFIVEDGTRKTVQGYTLINGIFIETEQELLDAQAQTPNQETIFNEWYRFSHSFATNGTIRRNSNVVTFRFESGNDLSMAESFPVGKTVIVSSSVNPSFNGTFVVEVVTTDTSQTAIQWTQVGPDVLTAVNASLNLDNEQPAYSYELTTWDYDALNDRITTTLNTDGFVGFISPNQFANYEHEVILRSSNADDDEIAVVIAWVIIDGREYTLSASRSPGSPWNIYYNRNRSDSQLIQTGTPYVKWGNGNYGSNAAGAGWSSNPIIGGWDDFPDGTRIKITRNNDIITAQTTDLGESTYIPESLITIDLSMNPLLEKFRGPKSYGYAASSQASASFEILNFTDPSKYIYDIRNNDVYKFSNGVWTLDNTTTLPEEVGYGRLLHNQTTNKTFYSDYYDGNTKISDESSLDGVYVNVTGDTMTGALQMGVNKVLTSSVPNGVNDVTNKRYVDENDFLNNNPKAGYTPADSFVPVYSDFKFGLGAWYSASFTFIDNDSKQVMFYHAATPLGKINVFRAWRFSDSDDFIFDNDPVSLGFLDPGEYVASMANLGTNFAYLRLASTTAPYSTTRWLIVKTGGASRWQNWTMGYDVTALTSVGSTCTNFSLLQDVGGDRILRVIYNTSNEILNVYDSSLTLLRSQTLFTVSTDVDPVDQGGGTPRTGLNITFGYKPLELAHPFTYDTFTQSLHQKNMGYYNSNRAGVIVGEGFALSISWDIPKTWILTGVGTPTNLVPIKNSTYRYRGYSDTTWDTETGGMSRVYGQSGEPTSLVTDEYTGNIFMTSHIYFSGVEAGVIRRIAYANEKQYITFGGSLAPDIQNTISVITPDGSLWAKGIYPYYGMIIGNNISFNGNSTINGYKNLTTTFSTTDFSSAARANDTLKLDAANTIPDARVNWTAPMLANQSPAFFSTTVVAGVPTYYWAKPGNVIQIGSASGVNRNWVAGSVSIPALPSTIGAVSGLSSMSQTVWNGSSVSPVIWTLVRNTTSLYVAKWNGSVWTISGPVFQSQLDAGNTARGDTDYEATVGISCNLLTEQNRWIFDIDIPVPGGVSHYTVTYNTISDTMTVQSWTQFSSNTAGGVGEYTAENGYNGSAFGYSSELGYYAFRASSTVDSAYIVSSRDVRGVGTDITEDQWFNNSATRYEVFVTTEPATGLVVYLSEYPIFLGGYFTKTPTVSINLLPSTVNYVYVTKNPTDRNAVDVSTSTFVLPNSFNRMLIAAVTTNATQVVSMDTFSFDGIGLPSKEGNAGKVLKTDGNVLFWDDDTSGAHTHNASDITSGTLAVARGGTGIGSYTAGNYVNALNSTTLQQRTPAQVLSDIGAAASAHNHDATYVNVTGDTMTGDLTISKSTALFSVTSTGSTPANINIESSGIGAALRIATPASASGRLNFYTGTTVAGGSPRWVVGKNAAAESGSNVGSDFDIIRYNDAGVLIDAPITISRSTGTSTFTGDVNITKSGPNLTLTGGSPRIRLLGSGGSSYITLTNDGVAGLLFYDGSTDLTSNLRWELSKGADNTLYLAKYNTSGAYESTLFTVGHTTNAFTFGGGIRIPVNSNSIPHIDIINTTGNAQLTLSSPSGAYSGVFMSNGGVNRWSIAKDGVVEGGSNIGGNLSFHAYSDAGVSLGSRLYIQRSNGHIIAPGVYNNTTADNSTLHVQVDSAGNLSRSTSSIRFKRDVEDIEQQYLDNILNLRPVWYRSAIETDNQLRSHFGLIAEEVALVEPRLTIWKYSETVTNEDGSQEQVDLETPIPDGVDYARLSALLLGVIKNQKQELEQQRGDIINMMSLISSLQTRIENLENK